MRDRCSYCLHVEARFRAEKMVFISVPAMRKMSISPRIVVICNARDISQLCSILTTRHHRLVLATYLHIVKPAASGKYHGRPSLAVCGQSVAGAQNYVKYLWEVRNLNRPVLRSWPRACYRLVPGISPLGEKAILVSGSDFAELVTEYLD